MGLSRGCLSPEADCSSASWEVAHILSDDLVANVYSLMDNVDAEGEVQYCQRIKTGHRILVSFYAIYLSLHLLIRFSVFITR